MAVLYRATSVRKLGSWLWPGGQAFLPAITIEDLRYVHSRDAVDYI